jgi:hypothetical protein
MQIYCSFPTSVLKNGHLTILIVESGIKHHNPNPIMDHDSIMDFDFWRFKATFSNISAIPWRPVVVVEEAGVPGKNHKFGLVSLCDLYV